MSRGNRATFVLALVVSAATITAAQQIPSPPTNLRIVGIEPVIWAVTATGITPSQATITWTTDIASDSRVEYGPTTAYGSTTALNTALVTAHTATLSGLSAGTIYHVRAHSRDAAGNPGASADYMFTTLAAPDTTNPVVSISAPAGGATVSGTISLSASATDNIGVAGVQFKVDGVNLGAEDTTAPYSVPWSTTTATNGPHALSAVARDAAGNASTSAVSVTVANDSTAPQISGVSASAITSAGATISWTTNEASDSQVQYGTTTAYGSTTALNGSQVTAHVATLSGLSASTLYHYRVRSRDAAGNLASSGDFTFTTPAPADVTAPVVSLTAPAAGAVSGSTTVSANATDNVGVVGVQFKLDGVNLGAEDTTAPYSISWNTTGTADGAHTLRAVARDAAGNTATSPTVNVTIANSGLQVTLSPEDTSLNLDETNRSSDSLLTTYTWPDNQVANATLMKFNLASLPAGAIVQNATLRLALVESDATADATYSVAVHKILRTNPVIAAATGYTADGATAWTPNACCHSGVPMAQADISPAYDARAVDQVPGDKAWTLTTLVQEWVAEPTTNLGLLLNSDASKLRDRYRYFASMENPDPNLRPVLEIAYTVSTDKTPPSISGVGASAITTAGATIVWTTSEAANSQVEYGPTTAYGSTSTIDGSLVTSHAVTLGGLTGSTLYHYRVRSRDAAGNVALSADFTFTTPAPADVTAPVVSLTAPAAGAVSGSTTVSANAIDNVGVVGVQFKLDGVNLGAEDTTAPYSISWNTTGAIDGPHTLGAVARDATGNTTTAPAVSVTVANSGLQVTLSPEDTSLNLDATNRSSDSLLTIYTWPDNQVANATLMKFNLASLPVGAIVQSATLRLALVETDATADATYSVAVHKILRKNPVIAAATGYTADGATAWTPNACCNNGVPMAQADISPAYDTRAVDKTPGYKAWTLTKLVQEWVAEPTTNLGLLLNSDASKLRDRYRYFASVENPDPNLRPVLEIAYTVSTDKTPPSISGVGASAIIASGATIAWTTNELANSQVEYGTTTAYGSTSAIDGSLIMSHAVTLGGLTGGTLYHYRVRSRDAGGNIALSGDFTFATPAPAITEATVSWKANTETDLAGYKVYIGLSSGQYQSAIDVGNKTSHTFTGLQSGQIYYFAVSAYDSSGNESARSIEVSKAIGQ